MRLQNDILAQCRQAENVSWCRRNWNWRASAEDGLQIEQTLRLRGHSYNGHPVSAGYFGSYAVDGLAVALHCVAATHSLDAAVERCLNFRGDADTTGAIVGQIAGGSQNGFPSFEDTANRSVDAMWQGPSTGSVD